MGGDASWCKLGTSSTGPALIHKRLSLQEAGSGVEESMMDQGHHQQVDIQLVNLDLMNDLVRPVSELCTRDTTMDRRQRAVFCRFAQVTGHTAGITSNGVGFALR